MAAFGYALVWSHSAGRVSPVVANHNRSTAPPLGPTVPEGTAPGSGVPGSAPTPESTPPQGSTTSGREAHIGPSWGGHARSAAQGRRTPIGRRSRISRRPALPPIRARGREG